MSWWGNPSPSVRLPLHPEQLSQQGNQSGVVRPGHRGLAKRSLFTFGSLSTTDTDYRSVTAQCGSSSSSINVVVYDILPSVTPADNFAGRDLTAFGVCEILNLSTTILPDGVTEYEVGGLQWQI